MNTNSVETTQEEKVETTPVVEDTVIEYKPKIDSQGRAYATGKRKSSIAKVFLKPGSGKITVNGLEVEKYLSNETSCMIVNQPFVITDTVGKFDITVKVIGGGTTGQAGAIKHGISKALFFYNPDYRESLKRAGFLTRDSRVVERKKYGRAKARKRYQFSKR